ncbi:MAG: DUF494 family protein [bacterium]
MKENVIDVLLYVFENFLYEEPEKVNNQQFLRSCLQEVGFEDQEVGNAIEWLDGLQAQRVGTEIKAQQPGSTRIYNSQELLKLDVQCRDFLQEIENTGIIDQTRREQIIDRALAIEEKLDVEDLKWIILMVLFNQPGQEAAYAWMENHLFDHDDLINH